MGPHNLILKRALASVGGVGCIFLKELNRPSPEASRNRHLMHRLRTYVRGAVANPPPHTP